MKLYQLPRSFILQQWKSARQLIVVGSFSCLQEAPTLPLLSQMNPVRITPISIHSSLAFRGFVLLVFANPRRRPEFYRSNSSVDISICTGLRDIPQNVQGIEGWGVGGSSFHNHVSAKKKTLKTTKHCSGGGRVNYSRIFAVLRGSWNLLPGKSEK